jgi:lipopolysaccharide export system permease protein
MIKNFVLNKYLSKKFFKITFIMTLIFFGLGLIMNIFEEINFFKDIDIGFNLPLILSLLFVPSLLYDMFPFVILLSGIWFFLSIKKSDEILAMKVSGMSNLSIILLPSILSLIIGVIFITSINPITSVLVKKYETIKGSYEKDQDYLAAITVNGIWIREKTLDKNNIIKSLSLNDDKLMDVIIFEFNKNGDFIRRIEAESADISTVEWSLKNAKIIDSEGKVLTENLKDLTFITMYDIDKIRSLYSNLDTISFWSLGSEIKLLEERGYSTREMESKLQRSLAFPFFLLSMLLLSAVFTLGIEFKENNWTYVFIAIITSVVIYFFNDFSAILGETEKLPIEISVWMPVTIIFIFSSVGIIHANQK